MEDPSKRIVKMKINKGTYFFLSCGEAHEIRKILEANMYLFRNIGLSYDIKELE